MKTKFEQCKELFNNKDYKNALRVAKTFKRTISKQNMAVVERAYECFVRPDFYHQLGKTPEIEIKNGISFLETYFN